MNTLQDLLSNICDLKISTETFKEELGRLKDDFQKVSSLQKALPKTLLGSLADKGDSL